MTIARLDTPTIRLDAGVSDTNITHNYIHGGYFGIEFNTSDCTVAGAPTWAGCTPSAPISRITVSGNKMESFGEDAFRVDNFRNIVIEGNEITKVIENGNRNRLLQTVFGGDGLIFRRNYEHDNHCQGFFIKDGHASNVTLEDNLIVQDGSDPGQGQPLAIDIFDTANLVIRNNTIWDPNTAVSLRECSFTSIALDHNVFPAACGPEIALHRWRPTPPRTTTFSDSSTSGRAVPIR